MSVLIIGADRISAMMPKMEAMGVSCIEHWDTRRCKASKYKIPDSTELVVFFTDYLHHSVATKLKGKAKRLGLPTIYCRRSWSELAPKLQHRLDSC